MNRILASAISIVWLCLSAGAQTPVDSLVQPRPALPATTWNVCPGEGCHFGAWTARASVPVYDSWEAKRAIGKLLKGDKVTSLTGVVVFLKPGKMRIDKDLPDESLKRGDIVFTYTYYGEGVADVWFHGRFHRKFDISWAQWPDGGGCQGDSCSGRVVDQGRHTWWVQVRLPSGLTGWVESGKADFDGVCSPAD